LLKEVHHRVKNNMQIISSLLKMQASYIKDEEAGDLFKDSCNRVKSMAIIHEKLYLSKNLAYIDFKKYLGSLIPHLFSSYGVETSTIQFEIDVNNVLLNINKAIPCGLIVNELISNSLKHAFPKGRKGIVSISMHKEKDVDDPKKQMFMFIIKDNGIGLPKKMDVKNTDSLGFKIIYALTEQLHGNIELDRRKGLTIKIKFNV
ncbi:MAG: sensor histidine kinase, partial [Candidatus Cloacimonetes bacterium]|nr:sensor histidine kinase [Candidatus Cloacimonadota bacterium]